MSEDRDQRTDVRKLMTNIIRCQFRLQITMPKTLCFIPHALCPMPHALCPMPHALCPMPIVPNHSFSTSQLLTFPTSRLVPHLATRTSHLATRIPQPAIHLGTGIPFKISSITSLTDRPSISNSGRSIKRCSKTAGDMVLISSGVI